jgi:hypothetical protein
MAITDEELERGGNTAAENTDLGAVGGLIRRIAGNAKAIAADEVELVRAELTRRIKAAVIDAAMVILGGMIVLIALGFLGGALVVALEPLVASLALRFVIAAAVYAGASGGLLVYYGGRLKSHLPPDVPVAKQEAIETIETVKAAGEELTHA